MTGNGKRLKFVLLGASLNTRNMGVSALTAGAIKAVRHAYPDADVSLLDYAKESETHNFRLSGKDILVPLVNIRFSKKFYLRNNIALLILLAAAVKLLPIKSIREAVISNNRWLKHIYDADIVASIAGGDSFSDIYGLERFMYVALPQVLAVLMGSNLVQLPQTIGPLEGWLPKKIAKYIMENSSVIYSRDYAGMIDARELLGLTGASDKVRFCHDVAFIVDPSMHEGSALGASHANGSALVGLNISGLLYAGGYTRDNMFGLKADYKELISDLIDHLIRNKQATVALIPHVFGGRENMESDSAVCASVYEALSQKYGQSLRLVEGRFDHSGIKSVIGECDFFIGSRMHACIAALSQNIPAVSIAYSKKFIGVMESIGLEDYVVDPCRLDKEGVIKVIDRAFDDMDKMKKRLEISIPRAKESVLSLFSEVPV